MRWKGRGRLNGGEDVRSSETQQRSQRYYGGGGGKRSESDGRREDWDAEDAKNNNVKGKHL